MINTLGSFAGATGSEAYDINDTGMAVGRVFQPGGLQAALWVNLTAPPFLLGHLGEESVRHIASIWEAWLLVQA
jgi:hypothetical protein